jgi:hypothetical protein
VAYKNPEDARRWREANRDRINEYQRQWREDHREEIRTYQREYMRVRGNHQPRVPGKTDLERYQDRRALLDALKDFPCADCGNRFPPVCMDFDHRPGEVKLFNIGRNMHSRKWAETLAEIDKCDLVCANCHRIRTHSR